MNRFYRVALLVLIALASFATAQAKVVDRSEAMQTAANFLRSHSSVAVLSASNVKEVWNSNQLSAAGVATVSATSAPTFYVFAPETGTGFVIVSGDDATESILGYSDESAFETEDMPCTFLSWCEAMDNQITYYRQTGTVSARKTARENGVATLASSSLLLETASWYQFAPYYNDCPKDGSSRSVTGCVATSLAIAMRYHQYPTTGKGKTEAYYTETKNIYVESRDLSSHTYNWSNMPLSYSGSYTSTQASAVATLMADIGAALKADYTSSSTGAATSAAVMYENFGYSSKMAFIEADSYSDNEWTALMEDQLKNVGPIPYACSSMDHQFILDGYNTSDQFHINWGWGGSQNGYFYLPDIETGSGNTQSAVLNFYPDDGSAAECTLTLWEDISTNETTLHQNGEFTMNEVYVGNKSPVTFNGKIAYVLTDSEGNIKEHISGDYNITSDLGLAYNLAINFYEAPCVIESELETGDCIRMAYQNSGYDDWKLVRANGEGITDAITITSSMIGDPVELQYSVLMYDAGLTTEATTFAQNAHFTVTAEIVNNSLADITDGYAIVALCDKDGNVKEWISDQLDLTLTLGGAVIIPNTPCVIRGDIQDGDRIRMFFQVGGNSEDHWKLIEPDTSFGNPPYEIVISESQIGDPVSTYYLVVYDTGVTVSRNTFYTGAAFTTNVRCVNFGSSAIPLIFKVALIGSDGEVKEWISDEEDKGTLGSMYANTYSISCTITGDVQAGDIIRPYYQDDTENWWALGENESAPTEVVLTADMISSVPVSPYNITVVGDGVTVSKETFYTGAAFNTNVNFESWEGNVSVKIKVAHVGSDGEVKEWISDEKDCGTASSGSSKSSGDIICSILEDVEAGDIIRPYYQGNSDGEWWTFGEYDNAPTEVEITEDKIGERPEEKSYDVVIYSSDPMTTADYFYPGVTFTSNINFVNWGEDMDKCFARFALTDSDGNIKEFLSEGETICPFNNGWGGLSNMQCTITGDVKVGDRIRVYYQADNYDTWHVMGEYYGSAWEYVITVDMVDDTLYEFVANNWLSPDSSRVTADQITYDDEANTITVAATGQNNVALGNSLTQSNEASSITTASYVVGSDQCCFIVVGSDLSTANGASELWWMNGYNGGMEVAPTKTKTLDDGQVLFLWDLTESVAGTNMPSKDKYLDGWTVFGLTSTAEASVISDIAFYSWAEAWAKYPELSPSRLIDDGEYLIVDTEGYYFGGGLTWGTKASTIGKPQFFGFTMQDDFTYHLDSHQYDGSASKHYLGSYLTLDDSNPLDWTLEEVDGGYTIYGNGGYLTSNGFQTEATVESTPYVWKLVTKDDVIASMDEATSYVPVDVTALVKAPELKRKSNTEWYPTWTVTGYDGTGTPNAYSFGDGQNTANCAASNNSSNGFKFSQDIVLPKAGYYTLSAQGFYRVDNSSSPSLPVLYAGDETAEFPVLDTSANSMADAYQEFLQGLHPVGPILIEATENETLNIGFKGEDTGLWVVMGEVELLYYGTEEPKEPEPVIAAGDYLMVDVEGNYLGGGLTWGTQATTIGKPQFIGFEVQEDFTYHLDSHQYNSATDHYLGANLYFDNGSPVDWTLEEVEGGYTIYGTGDTGSGYLTSNGFQKEATLETEPYVWTLVTKDEVIASMDEATTDVPVDVTALIAAPELKRNSNTTYYPTWTVTGYDGTGTPSNYAFGGGSAIANCAESYHSTNGFNINQKLTLPLAGYYSLSAKGFYRDDSSTTLLLPVLYAGQESVEFPELNTSANTMAEAYAEFLEGLHQINTILFEAAEDGETVTIGFKGEDTSLWNIFGELELLYYGAEEPVLPEGTVHECVAEFDHWSISGNTGGSFQRNTWSTEADPSGLVTPFIEYWVGAGNQLSDATISHTQLTEMTAGYYEVSIFARAFNEQSLVDISEGITFSANSQSIDLNKETHATYDHVSAEEYGTYKVYCQVGSDGKLDINFTLKGANCDWLAFKDLQVVHLGYSMTNLPELAAAEGTMNSSIEAAQTAALSAYASNATLANYNAAYQAVECAQVSVTFYAGVADALAQLDAYLDEGGKAWLEENEAIVAYRNNTLAYQDMDDVYWGAVKQQTTPGIDLTEAMENNGEWTGNTGTYQTGVERYGDEITVDGDEPVKVLYYTVEGLIPGSWYKVTFYAVANNAWVGAAVGDGIAQVFANDVVEGVTVYDQTACTITDYPHTLTCEVGEDGVLEFGLQNIATGGNWYVAQALSLTLVSVPIEWELTDAGWGTMILPFDAEVPDGLTVYAGDALTIDGSTIKVGEAASSIAANTPYLVSGTEGTYSFSGVATNTEDSYTVGVLTGTFVDMTYEDFTPNSGQYVLQNQTERGLAFYQISEKSEGLKLAPYHCYLTVPDGVEVTALSLPGMATGISAVEGETLANDAIYDLAGRKVSKAVKGGVYIINGRKVLVK